jgi:hypothetical protein
MDDDILAHMKERVRQIRRIIGLAHDPEMIAILTQVLESGQADIARIEAEREAAKP